MKTKLIVAGLLACIGITAQAQDTRTESVKGEAIVQVFGNFNTTIDAETPGSGFELERAYLGYEYQLDENLTIKGVMDIGKSTDVSDYHRIAYVKNAMISWKKGNFTLNGGLISTTQFNFQEKFWGYRYILKSFQDLYKFGNSADLGLSASYKITDWISADAIVVNGEGYKKVQKANGLNYGMGLTLTPLEGFQVRLYSGLNQAADKNQEDIVNIAAFAGYKTDRFTVGAEYNQMLNASYTDGADMSGYSAFASMNLDKGISVYARFDQVSSKDNWNIAKDQQAAIAGAQFKLGKYVKIAPNFRMSIPKADGTDNSYSAYISCYFGL